MRGLHFVRNYDPRFDYTPLGAWSYFLYTLLFSIPIIGFIFAIVFAVGGTNRINLRNYARSYFCWLLITVVLVIILLIVGFAIAGTVYNIFDHSGIITITCKKIQPESKKIKLTRGYLELCRRVLRVGNGKDEENVFNCWTWKSGNGICSDET